jgi:hypothetical protein
MGTSVPAGEDTPRPWADDDRLNDLFFLGNFNKVIRLIEEFATLAERLPQGNMPKTASIPKMWEAVKDLKPESLEKLHKAIQDMQEALASKGDRPSVGSKRGKEEATGGPIDSKKGKEEIEIEEIDSEAVKARKMGSSFEHNLRNKGFDEEGICIFHRSSHVQIDYMYLLPLLHFTNIVHARLSADQYYRYSFLFFCLHMLLLDCNSNNPFCAKLQLP